MVKRGGIHVVCMKIKKIRGFYNLPPTFHNKLYPLKTETVIEHFRLTCLLSCSYVMMMVHFQENTGI